MFATLVTVLIKGEGKSMNSDSDLKRERVEESLKGSRTLGNYSFVPFYDVDSPEVVLMVLDKFEKLNPELRVKNWRFQNFGFHSKHYYFGTHSKHFFGIWIDHEPREEKVSISNLDHVLGQD